MRRAELALARFAALAVLLTACSHVRPVGPPIGGRLPGPIADGDVRAAILSALEERGFVVEEEGPGLLVSRVDVEGARAVVAIRYDASVYAIDYRESFGLDETRDESGVLHLNPLYHRWMIALSSAIDATLRRAPLTAPPIALAPPVTAGGMAPADPAILGPAVPAGYGAAPAVTPPPATTTYVAPATTGGAAYGVPASTAPMVEPEPVRPRDTRPRRSLHEVMGVGLAVLAAGWVINWASTLALTGDGDMIGLSFIPLAGPFTQLSLLDWVGGPTCASEACYPRWTGTFYPIMGALQISGLILTIVGAAVRIPDGSAEGDDAAVAMRPTWTLVPMVSDSTAGALMLGSF